MSNRNRNRNSNKGSEGGGVPPSTSNRGPVFPEIRNVELTSTHLAFKGQVTAEIGTQVLEQLLKTQDSSPWWVGDALVEIDEKLGKGEGYKMLKALNYKRGTLGNKKSVSASVKPSFRNDNVSWDCHRLVAKLPPEKQKEWLTQAEEKKWSTRELRKALDAENPKAPDLTKISGLKALAKWMAETMWPGFANWPEEVRCQVYRQMRVIRDDVNEMEKHVPEELVKQKPIIPPKPANATAQPPAVSCETSKKRVETGRAKGD